MIEWTINNEPVDTLGIEDESLVFQNRAPDTLSFSLHGLADGTPAYAPFAEIVLRKNSTVWFRGIVTGCEKMETPSESSHRYTVSSPLWWLSEIVYEQNWNIADDPNLSSPTLQPTPSSKLILGQNEAGQAVSAGAQLSHILAFAIAAGTPMQAAAIDIPLVIPWEDIRDRTCGEALHAVLRWLPNSVLWLDHATTPPTVHVALRSALADKPIDPESPRVDRLEIRDRPDLARPAVVLRYHRVHRLNQSAWEQIITDQYPATLPSDWRKRALVSSIELAGSVTQQQWVEQPVETRDIPAGLVFGSDPADYVTTGPVLDFWKRKIPALAAANVTEITLRNGQHERVTALPKELIDGAITDWMIDQKSVRAERQTVRVEAMYKIDGVWVVPPGGEPPAFTAEIMATDATTRVYSSLEHETYEPPEPIPTGLAQSLYESLAGPWAEISLDHVDDECDGDIRPGMLLDGQPVQRVAETLSTGRTSIDAGPPEHLGHADLVALLRARRDRTLTDAWRRRATGSAAS